MANIVHDLPIAASPDAVFRAISTPAGLNEWWTLTSLGSAALGSEFELGFGEGYQWRARVTELAPARAFELQLLIADTDWRNTKVGFRLTAQNGDRTLLSFRHTGWASVNAHFRTSSCCWAMYLRLLRRYLEHGEHVPYDKRLDA